jgi:hypothetical protein
MARDSLIGLPLLEFNLDIGTVIRVTLVWLCCASRPFFEFGLSFCNLSFCEHGHIRGTRVSLGTNIPLHVHAD